MFKQYLYHVLFADVVEGKPVWKEEEVEQIWFEAGGAIKEVKTVDERILTVDNVAVFIRESTTKFDKLGNLLFGGDLVKIPISVSKLDMSAIPAGLSQSEIDKMVQEAAVTTDIITPIQWVNGAWCLCIEDPELTVYMSEQSCMQMEKVGNIYQHANLLEKPIDESAFEKSAERKE